MATIVMRGNLNEGYEPIGPFEDFDAADEWTAAHPGGDTWIMTLTDPAPVCFVSWICPGCLTGVLDSDVRDHINDCDRVNGEGLPVS